MLAACDAAARYWAARLQSRFGEAARALPRGARRRRRRRSSASGSASPPTSGTTSPRRARGEGHRGRRAGARRARHREGAGRRPTTASAIASCSPSPRMDGQMIGFGGRVLRRAEKGAKYINTPETPLQEVEGALRDRPRARGHPQDAAGGARRGVLRRDRAAPGGVANAVAVCGTALTPEHVELLQRCDCREVTILFDGDVAGLAAPAKAAAALFPAGLAGKVAVLPTDGREERSRRVRARDGRAGVEALLAAAAPLSEFLIDRAVGGHCAGEPREAPLEAKLAARSRARALRADDAGGSRAFRLRGRGREAARPRPRGALRAELSASGPSRAARGPAARRPADAGPPARPATARPAGGAGRPAGARRGRARAPRRIPAARGDRRGGEPAGLLPPGPARGARARPRWRGADRDRGGARPGRRRRRPGDRPAASGRLAGPARPPREAAERELRKAVAKAAIEAVARGAGPAPRARRAQGRAGAGGARRSPRRSRPRRRADLEKRLRSMERVG